MKTVGFICFALIAGVTARADFSYTTTQKAANGAPGAGATTKHYLKGQKMLTETGDHAVLLDFDAQTITNIEKDRKTYTVTKFSEIGQAPGQAVPDVKIDVKETGQRKNINGFDAKELVMTVGVSAPTPGGPMNMQMEMSLWLSADVPGKQEMVAFYKRNADRFPWATSTGGGNPQMQRAIAEMQHKMSSMDGVPVLQVMRMKPAGGDTPQAAQMQQQMAQARARLEEMAKQGGPAAAAAQQALARMGPAASGGALFETQMESSNFSTGSIPDSVFAIPAGFQKVDRPAR